MSPSRTIPACLAWLCLSFAIAAGEVPERPTVDIPLVDRAPTLEDFLSMGPSPEFQGKMARVEGFIQRTPEDGRDASQRTQVYIGYDRQQIYVVFVAFDEEPEKIRARMNRRENVFGDEIVEVMFDTFYDQQRAYAFVATPLGNQWDARWTEGSGFDDSWDTVWKSRGKLTDRGYVVLMSIPFKSLRFPATEDQTWGIIFVRDIPRNNESSFWPQVTQRINGRMNQEATLRGLSGISPGRNIQLIPYGFARRLRTLDRESATFDRDSLDPDAGLDAKFVLKDSLALDLTANPDFSQVESDQPQVTVNQRFEVFFPEKRPFFLENSSLFQTPFNLLFTRRIADPRAGARLTGKVGKFNLGTLLIDDERPGEVVAPSDPDYGESARFGILRLSRDLPRQSNIGFIYTDREFEDDTNRVTGIDGRIKLGEHWDTSFQAVHSATRDESGRQEDPAYSLAFNRNGLNFSSHLHYRHVGRHFASEPGFIPRTDIRDYHASAGYSFRHEDRRLISWRPNIFVSWIEDQAGTRQDWNVSPNVSWEFRRQTRVSVFGDKGRVRFENVDYPNENIGASFSTQFIRTFDASAELGWGKSINFVPPEGTSSSAVDTFRARANLGLRPGRHLRIDTNYFLTRLDDERTGERVLTDQILRTRWSWQFNSRLSLRLILQYESTRTDPLFTRLETRKNYNGDLLVSYLVNPWTAVYVGYNSNYQNFDIQNLGAPTVIRTDDDFINDARQAFVKISYLFRM